ncbi:uncharacterized protein BKA78DRAFT_293226 [Phyllosticta capitalensis]|uniref:uncharacterized protein n=1 Tax=Phyllosticta capitalensis TaxID=121624 RepID=UPI00312D012B
MDRHPYRQTWFRGEADIATDKTRLRLSRSVENAFLGASLALPKNPQSRAAHYVLVGRWKPHSEGVDIHLLTVYGADPMLDKLKGLPDPEIDQCCRVLECKPARLRFLLKQLHRACISCRIRLPPTTVFGTGRFCSLTGYYQEKDTENMADRYKIQLFAVV